MSTDAIVLAAMALRIREALRDRDLIAFGEEAAQVLDRAAVSAKLGVHLSHCNFGEHAGCCKYGEDKDCPALSDGWSWFGKNLQTADRLREKAAAPEARNGRALQFAREKFVDLIESLLGDPIGVYESPAGVRAGYEHEIVPLAESLGVDLPAELAKGTAFERQRLGAILGGLLP